MIDARIRLRHLRCFLETARLGSLSAAANALNVSQPAVSKTIRELEGVLGKPLFDRSNRRLTLTTVGRVFQQHVGAAMSELSRAQSLVKDTPSQITRLSVGVLPTAATSLMPRAALAFRESHPNCLLRVSTGPNWLLMSQLRDSSLDLVVGRMGNAEVMQHLSFHHLYSENIAAVVRPEHPLCETSQPLEALAKFPLLLPPPGAVIAPLVRALLSRHGIAAQNAAFESVSLAFGRRVVQSSDAVWFISRGVVEDELDAGTLTALPLGDDMRGGPIGISMRADGVLTDAQSGLIRALENARDALRPLGASRV
ncbi:pca operon transcription factor PcaQ [Marivita sp. XM-24bin2]|jgi:LysR family pca operon transcriptional activator|uniref:pca operon transcription factor PcaQ n=1 Tax=unclassified Marivita TaxID=2632480 RepID=UPI000D7AC2A3|nr:pca operon transcription factor PcaQ [Marivita sp. XM-24bin2]MCR9108937.1 pca operon transcription factor PcaQ [Paracoccaceae bacterium]PWL36755.1 MAG: pca operon transcription factor PcaQ [Marivita sp. XM-24bin2]